MTAEFAAVLPAVILVLIVTLGGLQLVGSQLRLQAATADAARAMGRGDAATAQSVFAELAGASVASVDQGDLICATGTQSVGGGVLARIALSATSCALDDGG